MGRVLNIRACAGHWRRDLPTVTLASHSRSVAVIFIGHLTRPIIQRLKDTHRHEDSRGVSFVFGDSAPPDQTISVCHATSLFLSWTTKVMIQLCKQSD